MFLRQHIDRCVDHNVRLPDFEATGKTFYSNAFITQFWFCMEMKRAWRCYATYTSKWSHVSNVKQQTDRRVDQNVHLPIIGPTGKTLSTYYLNVFDFCVWNDQGIFHFYLKCEISESPFFVIPKYISHIQHATFISYMYEHSWKWTQPCAFCCG